MVFSRAQMAEFIEDAAAVVDSLREQMGEVEQIGQTLTQALLSGQKVLTAGNGGSAAEALHLAEELTGKYRAVRKALPALCLNADSTALTCIANDWDYAHVFARQVEALAKPGDVLVLFSTSGDSENLLRAADAMAEAGGRTVGLIGKNGGKLLPEVDEALVVASLDGAHVQEAHQVVVHLLLEMIDAAVIPGPHPGKLK